MPEQQKSLYFLILFILAHEHGLPHKLNTLPLYQAKKPSREPWPWLPKVFTYEYYYKAKVLVYKVYKVKVYKGPRRL